MRAAPDAMRSGASESERTEPAVPTARASREDSDLVRRLLAGDEASFTSLVEHHHAALLRLAQVFVSSRAVAEEVVQETWVGVLDGLPSFEGRSSLKTWIFRILSNRAKTRGVREGRQIPFSSFAAADGEHEPAVDPSRFRSNGRWAEPPQRWEDDTPERILVRREALVRLEAALEELPPNQRAVVTLRDVEGIEPGEVCNILQISETNQRVLLHRARSKLRRALEEFVEGA